MAAFIIPKWVYLQMFSSPLNPLLIFTPRRQIASRTLIKPSQSNSLLDHLIQIYSVQFSIWIDAKELCDSSQMFSSRKSHDHTNRSILRMEALNIQRSFRAPYNSRNSCRKLWATVSTCYYPFDLTIFPNWLCVITIAIVIIIHVLLLYLNFPLRFAKLESHFYNLLGVIFVKVTLFFLKKKLLIFFFFKCIHKIYSFVCKRLNLF